MGGSAADGLAVRACAEGLWAVSELCTEILSVLSRAADPGSKSCSCLSDRWESTRSVQHALIPDYCDCGRFWSIKH